MLDASHLGGVITPLATPLTADESVDEAGLRRLVQHVVRGGVHGVFVMGTTGEFAALADDERHRAVEIVVNEVKGAVPVFVGVSDSSTRRALLRMEQAQTAGADAVVATVPYYQKPNSPEEARAHFEALAKAAVVPVLLYDIPQRLGTSLTLEVIDELRKLPQIVGIKDSSENFSHFLGILRMEGAAFRVFQGSELHAAASLLLGAPGCVPGMSNLAPKLWVALYEAARAGDVPRVRELHRAAAELNRIYALDGSSPIGSLKAALEMIGVCQAYPARPTARPDIHARARIEAEVKRFRDYM